VLRFRAAWALAAGLIAAFVFYESTRGAGDPTVPDVSTSAAYLGHFLLYAALAFSAQSAHYARSLPAVALVAACVALYGGALEAYQSSLSGRESSIFDALANLLGAASGAGIAAALLPRWGRWVLEDTRQD
jgi:VanZ family protein